MTTSFVCKCGSRMQVGNWIDKQWHCIWCIGILNRAKSKEQPPGELPAIIQSPTYFKPTKPKHLYAQREVKIEEIPCDNQL